ncbi:MAG: cytochrome c class I [Halothiobacillaceae bacterium]|nr:MAG: cytochrome c class I [Halothiobacillaceae bacterium]
MTIAAGRKPTSLYELGRDVYNYRCYFCHGYSGDGKTLASSYLAPQPRDFTAVDPQTLAREAMILAVTEGRPDSAMMAFKGLLSAQEIAAVVDFVRTEFMSGRAVNTRYHTAENGWPQHERFASAFPFILGEVALDTAWEQLTAEQQQGRRLFMSACVTCHDRAKVNKAGDIWNRKSVSYPRGGFTPADVGKSRYDGVSAATPYAQHDVVVQVEGLTDEEQRGAAIFQANCAFCHGADGSGKNWIGSFLQPHPRDLSDAQFMATMSAAKLQQRIAEGVPNTTMSAWKNVLSEAEIASVAVYLLKVFGSHSQSVDVRSQQQ